MPDRKKIKRTGGYSRGTRKRLSEITYAAEDFSVEGIFDGDPFARGSIQRWFDHQPTTAGNTTTTEFTRQYREWHGLSKRLNWLNVLCSNAIHKMFPALFRYHIKSMTGTEECYEGYKKHQVISEPRELSGADELLRFMQVAVKPDEASKTLKIRLEARIIIPASVGLSIDKIEWQDRGF